MSLISLKRATATHQTGSGWSNVKNMYDKNLNTYATAKSDGNSATYIKGFNFNIPKGSKIEKIRVKTRCSVSSSLHGYLYLYIRGSNASSNYGYYKLADRASLSLNNYWTTLDLSLFRDPVGFLNSNFMLRYVGGAINGSSTTRIYDVEVEVTYTPPYVIYDSYFSFKKWKDQGITGLNGLTINNITDTSITGTAGNADSFTSYPSYYYSVSPNSTYRFCFNKSSTGEAQILSFTSTNGTSWAAAPQKSTSAIGDTYITFTPPTGYPYTAHRLDWETTGITDTYSNFRVVLDSEPWRANTLSSAQASQRTNVGSWNMPTPQREGYNFTGWFDSNGIQYTSSSSFPTTDTILWSKWTIKKVIITTQSDGPGTVTGGGKVDWKSQVILTAVPDPGCKFIGWSDGNNDNPRIFNPDKDSIYTAIFKVDKTLIDINKPKTILLDNLNIKQIYIDNIKIYEYN